MLILRKSGSVRIEFLMPLALLWDSDWRHRWPGGWGFHERLGYGECINENCVLYQPKEGVLQSPSVDIHETRRGEG